MVQLNTDVEVMAAGQQFYPYEHDRISKAEGGRVYIQVSNKGEVTIHDGWLTRKEAKRARAAAERAARTASGEAPPSMLRGLD